MHITPTVRPLAPLNDNYTPPQPWRCATMEAHVCSGTVIGAVGAVPVCEAGAAAEIADQVADQARIDAWLATPEAQRALAEEARIERWIEGRVS